MLTLAATNTIAGNAQTASTVTVSIMGMELVGTTETYKVLYQGQLPSSVTTLYTAPASTTAFVKSIHVVNTAGATKTFALYANGTAAANRITPDVTLPANGWAVYSEDSWRVFDASGAMQYSGGGAAAAGTAISGIANDETTYTSGTVSLSALANVTIRSTTGNQFQFSAAAQSVQPETQTFVSGIKNTETTFSSGDVELEGTNNITVYSTTGQRFRISGANTHAQQTGLSGISNSETTYTSGTVGLSVVGGNMTIRSTTGNAFQFSVSQSVQAETQTFLSGIKNTETTYSSGQVELEGTNNITVFSTTGQRFRISGANTHAQQTGISALSNSNTTYTSGTVGLSELGAITIRSTTGNQFQFSVNSQTAQTGISGISNSNTTYTSGTVGLSELGAITIRSTTGNQFQFSVNSQTVQTQGSLTMYANSNTTQSSTGTANISSLNFAGAGIASVGVTGGSVVVSVPAGGGAGDGYNLVAAGTRTAGTASTVIFSNSNGVSFGLDANPGSVMTASIPLNATMSRWFDNSAAMYSSTTFAHVDTSLSLHRMDIPQDLSFSRVDIPVSISLASSGTTNTGAMNLSAVGVIYSRNGSTLNPIVGQSSTTTYTWASNTGVYSSLTGPRLMSFNLATALTPGEYYMGLQLSTHSTSSIGLSTTALRGTIAMQLGTSYSVLAYQDLSAATAQTINLLQPLQGMVSVSISNTTMTFQQSQITQSGATAIRANYMVLFRNN